MDNRRNSQRRIEVEIQHDANNCIERITIDNNQLPIVSKEVARLTDMPTKSLHPLEALYLTYKGYVLHVKSCEEFTFEKLARILSRCNPLTWAEFEVYLDLRRRGRIVSPGPRPHTLLVKIRRKSPKYDYYLLVLEEGRKIPLGLLSELVEEARKNNWMPLLAIVDRYGDIVYYAPTPFRTITEKG
ncbi:MAG TPA: hypothetical protein EYH59_02305 [Pyrodictium sp.]|nr:hypothetical protein [Pyrodictium sp.]